MAEELKKLYNFGMFPPYGAVTLEEAEKTAGLHRDLAQAVSILREKLGGKLGGFMRLFRIPRGDS